MEATRRQQALTMAEVRELAQPLVAAEFTPENVKQVLEGLRLAAVGGRYATEESEDGDRTLVVVMGDKPNAQAAKTYLEYALGGPQPNRDTGEKRGADIPDSRIEQLLERAAARMQKDGKEIRVVSTQKGTSNE